jgi:hypothetical protein
MSGRILVEVPQLQAEVLVRGRQWVDACRVAWLRASDAAARLPTSTRLQVREAEAHDRFRLALLAFAGAAEDLAARLEIEIERRNAIDLAAAGGHVQ